MTELENPDIFRAAQQDDVDEMNAALSAGQTLRDKGLNDVTPAHIASANNSLKFLKQATELDSGILDLRDFKGFRPIDYAISHSKFEACKLLNYEMNKIGYHSDSSPPHID